MRRASRLAAAGAASILLGCAAPVGISRTPPEPGFSLPDLAPGGGRPRQVVLVSVAGLGSEAYALGADGRPEMPVLSSLARAGAAAASVEPVAPASTYPAHATLVTGERPDRHGVPADRVLGERGVRSTRYSHASYLTAPTLWQRAREARLRVAALGWPSTVGAAIELLVPDVHPVRRGESWLDLLDDAATPWLAQRARQLSTVVPPQDSALRDALLATLACEVLRSAAPPHLLLLRLSQTEGAIARAGPGSVEARAAFSRVDGEIRRLLECVREAGRLEDAAFAVAGDRGTVAVHTRINPNFVLARAGLIPGRVGGRPSPWRALARSNGGSAFVYARGEAEAVEARSALESAARELGAFRVVSAQEMLSLGSDPEAWFGLAAMPGYVFGVGSRGPLLEPSAVRGGAGYLPTQAEMRPGFVAWGRGVRPGVRIAWMRQADIAPTLAALLGIDLGCHDGRAVVGMLELPAPSAQGAGGGR